MNKIRLASALMLAAFVGLQCSQSPRIVTPADVSGQPLSLESGKEYSIDTTKVDLSRVMSPGNSPRPLSEALPAGKTDQIRGNIHVTASETYDCGGIIDCPTCNYIPDCCTCCYNGFVIDLRSSKASCAHLVKSPPIKCGK